MRSILLRGHGSQRILSLVYFGHEITVGNTAFSTLPTIYDFAGRKIRHAPTTNETSMLMSEFSRSPYVTCKTRRYLAAKLGTSEHKVRGWFDRRRLFVRSLEAQINWEGD